jgi:hypothetical protein
LLGEADVGAFSRQIELALFYDAKLDVAKCPHEDQTRAAAFRKVLGVMAVEATTLITSQNAERS